MVLIVWYHTNHPTILDYPFYMPTLFFVSGLLLRPVEGRSFVVKKVKRLLIPFVFFYVVYYIFLLLTNFLKYHSVSPDIAWSIFDVFKWNVDNDGYICNYPLWFIWALLWTLIAANYLVKWVKNDWLLLFIAFLVSTIGYLYIKHLPTPLMLGRSTSLFVYFVAGYLFKKRNYVEKWKIGLPLSMITFLMLYIWNCNIPLIGVSKIIFELMSVSVILLYLSVGIQKSNLLKPLLFFGSNSMVVFGMHDMYLSILRMITYNIVGKMDVGLGILNWIIALLMMIPTIYLINKYIPVLAGKRFVTECGSR